ncbi:MAG: hypothetical protein AAGK93_03550 [Pseudomonadota bacterium]
MNTQTDQTNNGMEAARHSFSGKGLTESQFQEAWAITGIIHGEIQKTGSFREKLTDYAHAYARNEKFDAMRGETALRDIYQKRFNQTMNQTREGLMDREAQLPSNAQAEIKWQANRVMDLIKEGPTMPFYQAYDLAARELAQSFSITQRISKELMSSAFKDEYNRTLYEVGKEQEEIHHKPAREAEIAARKVEQQQTRSQSRSMS